MRRGKSCQWLPGCSKPAVEVHNGKRICQFCAAMLRARAREDARKTVAAMLAAPVEVPLGLS